MSKRFSKLAFGVSTASLVGLCVTSFAPAALAKAPGSGKPDTKQPDTTQTTSNTGSTTSSSSSSTGGSTQLSCNLTDVLIGNTTATACKGPFDGNDTGAGNPLLTELNKGLFDIGSNVTWSLAGKSDSDENNIFGFEAQNGLSTGTWSLDKALSSNTSNGLSTFVVSLKTSTKYSAYLFKDIDFSQTSLQGIFNTIGVALNGSSTQGKALSHASLFVATYAKPSTIQKAKVPEPSASIGLGLVVGGMVIARRRKSNSAVQK
ncbi:PEP-CTERM sorting domain-containing protein [Fischerella sp. PCC 9605]|uniref:PEP-CTERM sorting domain-containing protein n=1 Tax=Fischerella sp. PCC 9605 TaxID=1173024 RepID=UPI00047DBCD5|nr:PEP-CTERM sorting domain-containing protein [Fischerella sp. PCC 9605]